MFESGFKTGDLAAYCGVSSATIKTMANQGHLDCVVTERNNGERFYPVDSPKKVFRYRNEVSVGSNRSATVGYIASGCSIVDEVCIKYLSDKGLHVNEISGSNDAERLNSLCSGGVV